MEGLFAVGDAGLGTEQLRPGHHECVRHRGEPAGQGQRSSPEPAVDEGQVESHKRIARAPLAVEDGTPPMELECAVRYICMRYVGMNKSEGKLREGQRRLGSLRRQFLPQSDGEEPARAHAMPGSPQHPGALGAARRGLPGAEGIAGQLHEDRLSGGRSDARQHDHLSAVGRWETRCWTSAKSGISSPSSSRR